VKNGIYTEGALLSDYDPRRSGTSVRRCIDERDAIEIAHAIVRPAVEAATAELRDTVSSQSDRLDEWLKFEERSGWTLKDYCRERCPISDIHTLKKERDKAISELDRVRNLEREFGNRLIHIIEYSVNSLIDLPHDHPSRIHLFKVAEIAQGDSIKSGKRSLECNSCGSRPEQWGLLKGDEKPGDQCPCCYLDDYDCDGTLAFVKIDDDDKGY